MNETDRMKAIDKMITAAMFAALYTSDPEEEEWTQIFRVGVRPCPEFFQFAILFVGFYFSIPILFVGFFFSFLFLFVGWIPLQKYL